MADELLMPKLGMTMEEGVLTEWFVQEGDEVEQGEPLFEVMTDKINIEVEAPKSGVLLKALVDAGETVPVNQPVGYIGEAGEEVPEKRGTAVDQADGQVTDPGDSEIEIPPTATEKNEQPALGSANHTQRNGSVRATPSARRLARIHDIDLRRITGTGPRGRIQARDVERVVSKREPQVSETVMPPVANQRGETERTADPAEPFRQPTADVQATPVDAAEVPLTGIRKVIAERMVQSVQQVPHVTLNRWVKMQAASQLKREWEEVVREVTGFTLSLNDLLVMAAARALQKHPEMNATLDGDTIRRYSEVNIGIAVQTDDGLMVPVLHEVNRLNVSELVKQFREKVDQARNHTLRPEDTAGGTFTISNLGGYDIETFTPIINPPQAAILGVGKMVTRPEWNGDTWLPVKTIPLSLSFDHRVVDGAPAARFLQTLAHYLEEPRKLLI